TADADEMYALPGLTRDDVDAIVAYRAAAGTIQDPGGLVAANVISEDKLEQIAPFLIVSKPSSPGFATNGRARYRALVTNGDSRLPAMALDGRVGALRSLTLGGDFVLTHNFIGQVRADPARQALSAEPRANRVEVAKVYAEWK